MGSDLLHVDSKKTIQMNLFTKQKQTYRHRIKLVVTKGDTWRRETLGVWEEHTHTNACKVDRQQYRTAQGMLLNNL